LVADAAVGAGAGLAVVEVLLAVLSNVAEDACALVGVDEVVAGATVATRVKLAIVGVQLAVPPLEEKKGNC